MVIVCAGIVLEVPEAIKPVTPAVPTAVHENVVPEGLAVKITGVVWEPEQIVWDKVVFVMTGASLTENV